jgi:hypothetical protein
MSVRDFAAWLGVSDRMVSKWEAGTIPGPVNQAAGKATIQAELDGKHNFDLGNATITLSNQGKTAHVEGTSEALSDVPNAKITVDVTC